ncbi:MAG: carbohydrate ABC transporter permease, partial [Planctomycetota bacterium]
VPTGQAAALGAAMLMSKEVRGIGFFRSAWYLPSVLAGVGIAVLWQWVFDGRLGLFNTALKPLLDMMNAIARWINPNDPLFTLSAPEWFGADADTFGVPAFAIMSLWSIGGGMIIYLAGLNAIPKSLYEAAEIDGAGRWKRFLHVTIPMLSPVIFFNFVIAIIASFQVFTQAYVMTQGGPGDSTRFYVLYLYNKAFETHEMGYASAMAWILFVIVLACTLIVMRGSRNRIHYEGMRI